MDRAFTTILLVASLFAAGAAFVSASAAFWMDATTVMANNAVQGMAFEMAAGVAEAAGEAAHSGMAAEITVIFKEEVLVEASGDTITVASSFKGLWLNASASLAGTVSIQPSRIRSSSFTITGFPNGTTAIS